MAEIKQIPPSSRYDGSILNLLEEDILQNTFGDPRDFIEYHVYDLNDNLLYSNTRYTNYTLPESGNPQNGNLEELGIDIEKDLKEAGFELGSYRVVYNFFRKHINNDNDPNFFISQISSDRTEVAVGSTLGQGKVLLGISQLVEELNNGEPLGPNAPYFEEFLLNFQGNQQVIGINIISNRNGFLVKLLNPLPDTISINSELEVVEERSYPLSFEISFDEQELSSIDLTSDELNNLLNLLNLSDIISSEGRYTDPNTGYSIDINDPTRIFDPNGLEANVNLTGRTNFNLSGFRNQNRFSPYYTFSSITDATNEQFAQFLNYVSKSNAEISIDFTSNENELSSSFYNFVHFSSAKERLDNFKYKIEQIEYYTSQSQSLVANSANVSYILKVENDINNIKGNFDSFEKFLYYTSSSLSWPKSNTISPYTLYHSTSSEALIWFGSNDAQSIYYGGQLLSASQFDNQNPHNLIYTLPGYVLDDFTANRNYIKYVNMIGQMFDEIWIYVKSITNLYKNKNSIDKGVSKELVVDVLESLGFDLNNEELSEAQFYDFLLGNTQSGSIYVATGSGETLISSSNYGSTPKADIVREKYKRIFHNLSYLYKTKGTLRGLKSLILTFGIPTDLISIEEITLPSIDSDIKQEYEKFHYSLNTSASRIEIPWLPLQQNESKNYPNLVADAIEFMFNDRNNINSGSYLFTVKHPLSASFDFGLRLDKVDDINGKLTFLIKNQLYGNYVTSSIQAPIYNFSGSEEGWWNVLLTRSTKHLPSQSGSSQTYNLFLKKKTNDYISHQYSSSLSSSIRNLNKSWTNYYSDTTGNIFTSSLMYIGSNVNSNYFSGSFMELRYWSEPLSESVFNQHVLNPESIEGNNLYASYNDLSLRLPLGSDTTVYQLTSSIYPTGFNGISI